MDAVGADQHIGTERQGLAVSVAGADQYAAVALFDALHAETGAYRLLAETLAHRGEQDHLQFAAMDRVLRIGVAGFHPARLGPYRGAALVDVAQLMGGDGGGRQRRAEAQFGEGLDRRRLDIDADARGRISLLLSSSVTLPMPAWCRARAQLRPPMPAPAMRISMGSLMGASFSRVFESMGVRLGRMTVYRHETSAQRRITPVALSALRPGSEAAVRMTAFGYPP